MFEDVTRFARAPQGAGRKFRRLPIYKFSEKKAYFASLLFPGAFLFPSSISYGALNILGLFLFVSGLFAIRDLYKNMKSGQFVLVLSDLFVLAMAGWMILSLLANTGIHALSSAGAFASLQFVMAYCVCRVFFANPVCYDIFAGRIVYAIAVVLIYALLDVVTFQNIVSRIGYAISQGTPSQQLAAEAYRFGLVRAEGSLEHPILMGIFFVISSLVVLNSGLPDMRKAAALVMSGMGLVLALSSSPILSAFMALGLMLYFRIFSTKPWSKLLIIGLAAYVIGLIFVLFENPIQVLIKTFTLDPQTGLYRMEIWRWVAINVRLSPWIGIGNEDWVRGPEMSATIDSLWLVQSLRYGIPASVFLLFACLTPGITLSSRKRPAFQSAAARNVMLGLGIATLILIFNAFTVHFWGTIWCYLGAILGLRAGFTEMSILTSGWTYFASERQVTAPRMNGLPRPGI